MKLRAKDFQVWKNEITLIPTIQIVLNEPLYPMNNIELSFHFLVFHARLLWVETIKFEDEGFKG